MSSTDPRYRADIDGLRAVAIVPVILFHANFYVPGGFIGVDVFFVISGYLISKIIINEVYSGTFSFWSFYERRFRRLFPALFFMLAATTAAFSIVMLPEDFLSLAASLRATLFIYANFYFYGNIDYFSQPASLMPFLHNWSLAIEEQFYIFLPILLIVSYKFIDRKFLPIVLLLCLAFSLTLCIYFTEAYRPRAFYMPYTRAWELLAGSLVNFMPAWRRPRKALEFIGHLPLLALLAMFAIYDERGEFPGILAAGPVLATAVLLYVGAQNTNAGSTKILSLRPFVHIGKISYSLYLWHWPIIVFANYTGFDLQLLQVQLACIACAWLISNFSWRFIEEPFRRKRLLHARRPFIGATALLLISLTAISITISRAGGFPTRIPPQLSQFLDQERYATPNAACFPDPEQAIAFEPCKIGMDSAEPNFLIIGDSHAYALMPGISQAAESAGIAGLQFTSSGFFPGPGRRMIGEREDKRIPQALQLIERHSRIKTVVLSGAWSDYATGENWKGRRWLYEDHTSTAKSAHENVPIFDRGLRALIGRFPDRLFLVLDDVPAGKDLDLRTFVRHSILSSGTVSQSYLPLAEAQKRRDVYEPVLERISQDFANVRYIRLFDDFCGKDGCSLFADNTPVFQDGDHLSHQGALMMSDRISQRLIPQIGTD